MNKKIYKLEHLTEYIAKFEKAVPTKICESLTNSIVEAINNNVSFKQTDIELLSNIQTQLYITYKNDVIPKIDIGEDSSEYSLELDFLKVESNCSIRINAGADGSSHRFVSFMFVTDAIEKGIDITFNRHETISKLMVGDIIIFPPFYDHLICINTGDEERFCSVTLHACMLY